MKIGGICFFAYYEDSWYRVRGAPVGSLRCMRISWEERSPMQCHTSKHVVVPAECVERLSHLPRNTSTVGFGAAPCLLRETRTKVSMTMGTSILAKAKTSSRACDLFLKEKGVQHVLKTRNKAIPTCRFWSFLMRFWSFLIVSGHF